MSLHPQSRQLIKLTTHPSNFGVDPEPLKWGAREPLARGPVVATVSRPGNRNAIGAHGGTYSVYRAVAMAAQKASSDFVPDYTNTLPPEAIGPFDAWFGTKKIVSLDPWGHVPQSIWADRIADRSLDIRPTIAVTKSHLDVPEIKTAVADGRMKAGGAGGLDDDGNLMTTKAAIEPVWYLPGVAERFGVDEGQLRRLLYEQTGGMFPELVTRPDLKLFLPPINGVTVYIVGDVSSISKPDAPLVVRLHDESCAAPRNSARNYSARNSPTVASRPNRRHAETASEARRLLGVVASSKLPDDKAPPASGKTASAKVEQVNVASARAVLSELRVGGGMDATVIVERVVDIQRTFRGICGAIRMAQLCAQFSERRVGSPAGRVVRLAMEEVKKEAEKPLSLSAARDARDSYLPKKVDADGKPTHELLSFFCPISTIGELVNTARRRRHRPRSSSPPPPPPTNSALTPLPSHPHQAAYEHMLLSRWLLCLFLALFLCSLPSLADNLAGRGLNTTDFMLATTLGNADMIGEANDHTRAKTEAGAMAILLLFMIGAHKLLSKVRTRTARVRPHVKDYSVQVGTEEDPLPPPKDPNSAAGYQQQADAVRRAFEVSILGHPPATVVGVTICRDLQAAYALRDEHKVLKEEAAHAKAVKHIEIGAAGARRGGVSGEEVRERAHVCESIRALDIQSDTRVLPYATHTLQSRRAHASLTPRRSRSRRRRRATSPPRRP